MAGGEVVGRKFEDYGEESEDFGGEIEGALRQEVSKCAK